MPTFLESEYKISVLKLFLSDTWYRRLKNRGFPFHCLTWFLRSSGPVFCTSLQFTWTPHHDSSNGMLHSAWPYGLSFSCHYGNVNVCHEFTFNNTTYMFEHSLLILLCILWDHCWCLFLLALCYTEQVCKGVRRIFHIVFLIIMILFFIMSWRRDIIQSYQVF